MLQHGAYTLLIDSCYDRERFPTLEEAIDWTWASSKEEIEAVEFVLKKFFEPIDGVYVQSRIKEEIEAYQAKSATNKRIAQEREAKRKAEETSGARNVDGSSPDDNESPPNQEPRTTNQEPIKPLGEDSPDELAAKRAEKAKQATLINEAFDFFWSCWPTKKNKQPALRAFAKIVRSKPPDKVEEFVNMLSADIEKRLAANDFGFDKMHAATYLNGARWEDDLSTGETR